MALQLEGHIVAYIYVLQLQTPITYLSRTCLEWNEEDVKIWTFDFKRGCLMPHYVVLMNFTEQGVKDVKNILPRIANARQLAPSKGATLHSYFMTLGQHDAVAVIEAPDDETIASLVLSVGGAGNLRSTTLRAFTIDEIPDVLRKI